MLCNKLYDDVKPFFGKISGGIYPDDVLEVIQNMGFGWKEFKRLPRKGKALVALKWKEEGLSGHYIVWDCERKQFLDPKHGLIDKEEMMKLCNIDYIWKIEERK